MKTNYLLASGSLLVSTVVGYGALESGIVNEYMLLAPLMASVISPIKMAIHRHAVYDVVHEYYHLQKHEEVIKNSKFFKYKEDKKRIESGYLEKNATKISSLEQELSQTPNYLLALGNTAAVIGSAIIVGTALVDIISNYR